MKKIAILTGATGGLGREFLKQILNEDLDEVWAIARNKQRLSELHEQYGEKVVPVSIDLSEMQEIEQIRHLLDEKKPQVMYLINNAGLAKMGKYNDYSTEEIDRTINVNCKAPVMLAQFCIPYMRKGSRIINISSASAFQPNPYINLYAASKAFERSYSRALNVELEGTGITSTAVCPGWIDTELLQKEINGKKVKFPGLVTADKVVKLAIQDAKKGKDMSVCSLYVKCQHVHVKLLPQRWVMKIWMAGISKYLKEDEMYTDNIIIRLEKKEEYREVENLVRESFWNVYRPGCLEHYVLNQLRNDSAFVPELNFVMEQEGKLIGQNMFMRTIIKADDGRDIPIMTMGPICIIPELKRKGYGKILLDYSLEKAKELGCGAVCFEGNIDFYGKSGFACASTFGIRYHGLPEGEDASFFLCKELIHGYLDGITGEYATPQGYFVDEAEAEIFDKEFPVKEKLKLPGQLF